MDRRGVHGAAPVEQGWPARVTALPPDRTLAGAARVAAADPGTPLFPLLDSACSSADTASLLLTASRSAIPSAGWSQRPGRRPCPPSDWRWPGRSSSSGRNPGTRLQDAVGEQVVQARVGALDDRGRQRGHGAGGVLDHVAHDRPEAVGDAVGRFCSVVVMSCRRRSGCCSSRRRRRYSAYLPAPPIDTARHRRCCRASRRRSRCR